MLTKEEAIEIATRKVIEDEKDDLDYEFYSATLYDEDTFKLNFIAISNSDADTSGVFWCIVFMRRLSDEQKNELKNNLGIEDVRIAIDIDANTGMASEICYEEI